MDILSALEGTSLAREGQRCKIGRWLDTIDPELPGRADLVATLEECDPTSPHYRRLDQLDALTMALGFGSSIKTIGDHRAKRCRCNR